MLRTLVESPWRAPAMLFAVVFLCYLPGLFNGFLWIDHSEIVDGAVRIRGFDDLPRVFLTADNAAGYHRPVYSLIHTLDHAVWGRNAAGYYLSSAVLHALNAALLVVLLRRCRFDIVPAIAVAAVWGLHPVHTAVAGLIHAKADVFGLTCLLVALLAFVRLGDPTRGRVVPWIAGLAAFVLGAWTKESVFLLPIALAAVVLFERPRRRWGFVEAMGGLALALGALHFVATSGIATHTSELALGERALTFLGVYLDYLGLLAWPKDLSMSDAVTLFSAETTTRRTMIVIGFAVVVAGQIIAAARWPALRKWVLLFHLTLLPVAQLVPILHFRADRYLYLPSIAFAGAVVEAIVIFRKSGVGGRVADEAFRQTLVWTSIFMLAAFAVRANLRLLDFRDDITLFSTDVTRAPEYREGLTHLARAYERIGQLAAAERCYQSALDHPRHVVSYVNRDALLVNLTNNLLAQNKPQAAFETAAANLASVRSEAHRTELKYNQAVAAYNIGRYADALPLFREYGRDHPDDAVCLFLIGASAARTGDVDLAREALRRYLALRHPDPERNRDARTILDSL